MELESVTSEQKLLILLSRLTFGDREIEQIENLIMRTNLNWFEFFKLALYHKTATLCWRNINRLHRDPVMPKYLYDMVSMSYYGISHKNKVYREEVLRVLELLRASNTCVVPVKGATLIENMYKDYGIRYSGDADFLVRHEDVQTVEFVMESLGYIKGSYNPITGKITPAPREELLKWKIYMSNLYPYVQVSDDAFNPVFKFDFRYALDDSLSRAPVNEIVDTYEISQRETPEHVLIHLCTHFFDEAKHSMTIKLSKDFNIIKLCDIREYILQFMNEKSLARCIAFAEKHGLKKQLYFVMYYLNILYSDGYELKVMDQLSMSDLSFIDSFGKNTISETEKYDKSISERLFSCGNWDELSKLQF